MSSTRPLTPFSSICRHPMHTLHVHHHKSASTVCDIQPQHICIMIHKNTHGVLVYTVSNLQYSCHILQNCIITKNIHLHFYTFSKKCFDKQWWHYTRACQVKWPGWKIHRPGSRPASVKVWTENNNVTTFQISDHFACFILKAEQSATTMSFRDIGLLTTTHWGS